jgi:HAMP domain-containing protein
MVTAAGLKLAAVTPRPYAVAAGLVRAFASGTVPAPNKTDAVVALTLSPNGGEFTVVRGGEVTLTLAIPSPVMASETMLVAQLRRNLAVYAGSHPTHPIQAVYLAEVGSGWAEKLGTALGLPVHAYDPLVGAVPQIAEPLRGRFAGAVGLLAGKSHESLPINFASPRQPIAERDPGKRRLVFAALAAVLLLAAGAAFGFMMLNAANKRVESLTQTKNELTEKINNGKSNTTRLNAIESWAKREVNYLEELHDLADRLPPDDTVRISSITSNPLPVGKDGKQESQAKMQISLVAVGPAPVNTMVSAMERDNAGGKKFYTKTEQATRPAPPPGTPAKFAQAFSVNTNVAHREPEQYLRKPTFTPPKKSWGAFGGTPVAPPETPPDATAKTPPDVAPMPSEPMMPFEEIP